MRKAPNTYLPTLPKRLCLVFSNLCNILMLIAVQSSAPFERREGVAPHILCADSALQVILADIKNGNASDGERKVCTLNAKGTAGRRRPKRSRQKLSSNYLVH